MNKLHSNKRNKEKKDYAQYGLGYRFSNPYNYSDIPVAAATSYLSMNNTLNGMQFREDGTQRYTDNQIKNFSLASAGLGAINSLGNAYGQRQDNKREQERLQRIKDSEYYNVPLDRYAYNSQSQNSRQNNYYQDGGFYNQKLPTFEMPASTTKVNVKPVSLDSLNLYKADQINYNNVTQIEMERMKMLMEYPKGTVQQIVNGASNTPYTKKFRYREKQDGGYIPDTENDFYDTPINETYQSNDNDDAFDKSDFFLNSSVNSIEEADYSAYVPKFAHEDDDFMGKHGNRIDPVVKKLKEMGLNPSSINTGKHNANSKHYHGKAVDLGLNTTFKGNVKKMNEFKNWFNNQGKSSFPGVKLIDESRRPNGQKVWSGAHLHLEL